MAVRTLRTLLTRRDPGFVWDLIGQTGIVASLFLLPLVLLPWTQDSWETNKMLVLFLGTAIGWIGFFAASLARQRISFTWTRFDWLVVAFMVAVLISGAFSVDTWMSWVGTSGAMSNSMLAWLIGGSFYFLTSRYVRDNDTRKMWWWALGGGLVTSLLLQAFQLSEFSLLPSVFSNSEFLTTISNNALDIALIAAAIGTAAMLFVTQASSRLSRLLGWAVVILSFIVLVYFSQALAWAIFALGMITIVLVESRRGNKMQTKWIAWAVVIAGIGMVIQLSGVATRSGQFQPTDIRLDSATSHVIMGKTLSHRPIFGSGPATWFHDFVQYRPVSFNSSPWWSNRFVRSRTGWSEMIATLGVVGAALWAAVLGYALLVAWRRWSAEPSMSRILIVFGLAATLILGLFAPWSLVWLISAWVLMGLVRSESEAPKPSRIGPGVTLGFALTVLAVAVIGFFGVQYYSSEVLTQRGQIAILNEKPPTQVRAILLPAIEKNPHSIPAASLYSGVLAAEGLIAAENNQTEIASTQIQAAVANMERVIGRNPKNPVVYEEANNILNRVAGIAVDADERARQYFDALRKLEPTNPIHEVGYGQTTMVARARLLGAQTVTDETKQQAERLLKLALDAYSAALKKKPDYLQAHFARAQALVTIEKYSEAVADLERIKSSALELPTFWIQYAITLSKLDRNDEALNAFERAITLNVQDATAYLALAQHYQDKKDPPKAKATIERGLKAIPNDPSLAKKLTEISE